MLLKAAFVLCFAYLASSQRPGWNPRFLNKETVGHPGFLNIYRTEDTSLEYEDQFTMYISTFDPLLVGTRDQVWYMRSVGRYLNDITSWRGNQLLVMDQSALWPNNMDYVPSGVTNGSAEGIIQTSGFIVTGRKDGQLQYYDTTTEPPTPDDGINIAANDDDEYSYHRVIWMDMDNDGDLDALTAKFAVGTLGGITTGFLWLENIDNGFYAGWPEHFIAEGPDVHFDISIQEVGGRNYTVVVVGEFWNRRVSLWWTENPDNDWTDTTNINARVIWDNNGQIFDVVVGDYNKDGIDEFTITEFYANENNGIFRFFFFPSDFRTEEFGTTIIAQGFQAPESGIFGEYMTPGTPMMFYPTLEDSQGVASDGLPLKPYLLLSGDDDGCFYIFTPADDEARQDFTYNQHILVNTSLPDNLRTVGKMDTADLDDDGYEEIILAAYGEDALYVYSYCSIDCGY